MNPLSSLKELLQQSPPKNGVVQMIRNNMATVVTSQGVVTVAMNGAVSVGDQVSLFDGKCQRYGGKMVTIYV